MRTQTVFVGMRSMLLFAVSAVAQTSVTTSGGTANTVPLYTGSSTLGNSPINVSNGDVGIGTLSPPWDLTINSSAQQNGILLEANGPSFEPTFLLEDYANNRGGVIRLAGGGSELMQIGGGQVGITPINDVQIGPEVTTTTDPYIDINYQWIALLQGNVGIGTTSPGAPLEVDGNIKLTSGSGASITFADGSVQSTAYNGVACGGDYAESVDVTGDRHHYGPGDLLVLDPDHPGDVLNSAKAYSTSVAGIYSTKPGYVGRRQIGPKSPNEVPMAMVGIVPANVTTENGPIQVGDLLVSSSTPGYAMKGTDRGRMLGAALGKAMGNLQSGKGVIEVLVTLQ